MTEIEAEFFQIVDAFARAELKCFLAEFSPKPGKTSYRLCFRPVRPQSRTNRDYDCCYVTVDASAIRATADTHDANAQERVLSDIAEHVKASAIFT